MQNNQSNPMKRLWKDKGYYILLGLCLLVVGVSGYFFVTGALHEKEAAREVLSIPVTAEEPKQQKHPAESKETAQPEPAPKAETVLEEAPAVVLPVNGAVLQDHAMDRLVYSATTKDWRVHNGVDLAAEVGQTVWAARAGQVAAVYTDDYYGTTVELEHDGGYTSRYSNLAENTAVSVGDTVSAGTVIGTVGATALIESASESHLHFEVYQGGEAVDPAGFLY